MSNEDDNSIHFTSSLPEGLCAEIMQRSMQETELKIMSNMMYEAGVLEEFEKYLSKTEDVDFWGNIHNFCKLHPEKFHITDEVEGYAQYVSLNRQE